MANSVKALSNDVLISATRSAPISASTQAVTCSFVKSATATKALESIDSVLIVCVPIDVVLCVSVESVCG